MSESMNIAGHVFALHALTLADTAPPALRDESAAILALFLEREAGFGVDPRVVIDHPDLREEAPASGFLSDAAAYAAKRATAAFAQQDAAHVRIVVLTTYGNIVQPSFAAAGYECVRIDMPAGPQHTAAFILAPGDDDARFDGPTLYIEAVNEHDDRIEPSFVLKLTDASGRLRAGAYGSIHERGGRRYAYLAAMTLASGLPPGSGTAFMERLVQFLRGQAVATVHVGTQTAGRFYEKTGFKVEHRLVRSLRVRRQDGRDIPSDLVLLSLDI